MGKLYTKYTLQAEDVLATYHSGEVRAASGTFGTGGERLMSYEESVSHCDIFRSESLDGMKNVLAYCDSYGRISLPGGDRVGYCENGEVKDRSGSVIAYYDGDIYGAAAAACAVFFLKNVGDGDSKNNADKAGSDGDGSVASLIFSLLGGILHLIWKLLKKLPFFGPYISIIVLLFMMKPATDPVTGGVSAGGAGLFFLAYLVLHTVLLIKCKKDTGKNKYWPIYVGFILFVVTLLPLWAVPAVAFQVGVLIWKKKKVI